MNELPEAVIIDDDPWSMDLLKSLLKETMSVNVTGTSSDPLNAVDLICSLNPDIVFMDIKMPKKNGFEVLDDLQKRAVHQPHIIFTTAHDDFALRAFDYAAFDYLLKPVDPVRLSEAIARFIEKSKEKDNQKIPLIVETYKKLLFKNLSGIVIIDPAEIVYIEADGNYSVFHLEAGKTETVTSLLRKIETQLPVGRFFRTSRSAIINTGYLTKINTKLPECLLVKNGTEFRVAISRDRVNDLISIMKQQ